MQPLDVPISLTFSLDDDAAADQVEAVLVALGYAPTRVKAGTLEPVGMSREQFAARYKLGETEQELVDALLCGARSDDERAKMLGVSPRTATWRRRALLAKVGVPSCEALRSQLRELPPGTQIFSADDPGFLKLRIGHTHIAIAGERTNLAAVAWARHLAALRAVAADKPSSPRS